MEPTKTLNIINSRANALIFLILLCFSLQSAAQDHTRPRIKFLEDIEVNTFNGNLVVSRQDIVTDGKLPIRINFYYNSNHESVNHGVGNGWFFNYNMYYYLANNSVVVVKDGGRRDVYTPSGSNYNPPTGVYSQLIEYEPGKFKLKTNHGTEYFFDDPSHKKLTAIKDRYDNTITFSYHQENLVTIQNNSGKSISLTWAGNHLVEVDYQGNAFQYEYLNGFLTKVTNPKGNSRTYQYLPNGKMSAVTDYNNNPVYIEYASGPVNAIKSCHSEMIISFVDNECHVIQNTSEGHIISTFVYDTQGRVKRYINPLRETSQYSYDNNNNIISITDFMNNTYRFSYDENGNMLSATNPQGKTSQHTYNEFNLITSSTDKKGNTVQYSYDNNGYLTLIQQPLNINTSLTYNNEGKIAQLVGPNSNTVNFIWDNNHNLSEVIYPSGSLLYYYDDFGNTIQTTDKNGNNLFFEYDDCLTCDRPSQVKVNDTLYVSFLYDAMGNTLKVLSDNTKTADYEYTYDELNRLSSAMIPAGAYQYEYDKQSNLSKIIDPNGHSMQFTYSKTNLLKAKTDGAGNTTEFYYDANGNIVQKVDANGNSIEYIYNSLNQLIRRIYPGNTDHYFYDDNGLLISTYNNDVSISYSYDAIGRITSITNHSWNKTILYSYDAAGNRETMTDPDGGVTFYTYDSSNRLVSLENPFGEITSFEYDAGGRVTKQINSNQTYTEYAYTDWDWLLSITNKKSDGEIISKYEYTYDRQGNRTSMVVNDSDVHLYSYDESHRIIEVVYPWGDTETFSYDGAGNRITTSINGTAITNVYNEANQLVESGDTFFSYDDNGNRISKTENSETTLYHYNALNQLVKIVHPDGTESSYAYDPLGNRITKVFPTGQTTHYLLDEYNVLLELDQTGSTQTRYTSASGYDSWLSLHNDNQSVFFHKDGLNSSTELTDEFQNVAATYNYSVFGQIVNQTGNSVNPYTYTGREIDCESGLYYYRSRYYDSKKAVFLTKDMYPPKLELPLSLNAYSYVWNNPNSFIDPTGEFVFGLTIAGIGVGLSYVGIAKATTSVGAAAAAGVFCLTHSNFAIQAAEALGKLTGTSRKDPDRPGNVGEILEKATGSSYARLINYADKVFLPSGWFQTVHYGVELGMQLYKDYNDLKSSKEDCEPPPEPETCNDAYFCSIQSFTPEILPWEQPQPWKQFEVNKDGSFEIICYEKEEIEFEIENIASWDPNEVIGPLGYDSLQWVSVNQSLAYTILFENDPEFATAPAQIVLIDLPVSENLNIYSLRLGSFGFGDFVFEVPPNLSTYTTRVDVRDSLGVFVDLTAGINLQTRKAFWLFESIDPISGLAPEDALAGFLLVNDSLARGEGFVNFTILPSSQCNTGDLVEVQASIFFDDEAPVITNNWINVVDALPPVSTISEIAHLDENNYNISFTGSDDPNGSGLSSYELYVSRNQEPYLFYGEAAKSTSLLFRGTANSEYRFFSRAKDHVGNREDMKSVPDTTITTPSSLYAGPDAEICADNVFYISESVSAGPNLVWTGGDGNFETQAEQIYYIPGEADILAGSVDLCLTEIDSNGDPLQSDCMTLTINPLPDVTCPGDMLIQFDELPLTLAGATPEGGFYSGTNIENNVFNPQGTSIFGLHNVNYTYSDEFGCTNQCVFTIRIDTVPALYLNDIVVSAGEEHCHGSANTILTENYVVEPGGSVTLASAINIMMQPGTHIQQGAYLHAFIDSEAASFCEQPKSMLAADSNDEPAGAETSQSELNLPDRMKHQTDFVVYPNPTTGFFTLELLGGERADTGVAEVYSLMGELIFRKNLAGKHRWLFDLADHPNGVYIVRVVYEDGMHAWRLIKR